MSKSMGSSLKIIFDHFLRLAFFFFSSKISIFYIFLLFYFTRTMKIITGRRHWVLTEESPRLTTMDDNNTLTVFAGYYTRSIFPLPAFHIDGAGIHPGLISLNEIMTSVLSGMHRTRFAVLQCFCFLTITFLPSQAHF